MSRVGPPRQQLVTLCTGERENFDPFAACVETCYAAASVVSAIDCAGDVDAEPVGYSVGLANSTRHLARQGAGSAIEVVGEQPPADAIAEIQRSPVGLKAGPLQTTNPLRATAARPSASKPVEDAARERSASVEGADPVAAVTIDLRVVIADTGRPWFGSATRLSCSLCRAEEIACHSRAPPVAAIGGEVERPMVPALSASIAGIAGRGSRRWMSARR